MPWVYLKGSRGNVDLRLCGCAISALVSNATLAPLHAQGFVPRNYGIVYLERSLPFSLDVLAMRLSISHSPHGLQFLAPILHSLPTQSSPLRVPTCSRMGMRVVLIQMRAAAAPSSAAAEGV